MALREDDFLCFRIYCFPCQHTVNQFFTQEINSLTAGACQTSTFTNEVDAKYVAVIFTNDNVLRYVNQTTGQIPGIGCTKCCISQAFTSTMAGCKVVQYGQAFTEVCFNRQVNNSAGRVSHQATHTSNLTNLLFITTGTRVSHHEDRVERIHVIHHHFCNIVCCFFPNSTRLAVPFIFGNQAAEIHFRDILYLFISSAKDFPFFFRNLNIGNSNGHAGLAGVMVTNCFNTVQKCCSFGIANKMEAGINQFANLFLVHQYA